MKRLTLLIAAGAFCLATATSAFAQGMPPQGERPFDGIGRFCALDHQWITQRMAEHVSAMLNLTDQQKPALKDLQDAVIKAMADGKAALCNTKPDLSSLPARLAFAEKRLQARLDGLKAIEPKFQAFYSALTPGQQAELSEMWQHHHHMRAFAKMRERMGGMGQMMMRHWQGDGDRGAMGGMQHMGRGMGGPDRGGMDQDNDDDN